MPDETYFSSERRDPRGIWIPTGLHPDREQAMSAYDPGDERNHDRRCRRRTFRPSPAAERFIVLELSWLNLQTNPLRHALDIPRDLAGCSHSAGPLGDTVDLEAALAHAIRQNNLSLQAAGDADSCRWHIVAERGDYHAVPSTRLVLNSAGVGVETVELQTAMRVVRFNADSLIETNEQQSER